MSSVATRQSDKTPFLSDVPSDQPQCHLLDTAAHQLSASLCTGAFARCTPAERQQLHTLTEMMAKAAQGMANFAHVLDSAAHQLATSLTAGGFGGCTTQERMQLHMLALFLVQAGEQAQTLTGRPRSLDGRERRDMPA